jgi:hypothetical protein
MLRPMKKAILTELVGAYTAANAIDTDEIWQAYTQKLISYVPSDLPPKKQKVWLLNLHEEVKQACGRGYT